MTARGGENEPLSTWRFGGRASGSQYGELLTIPLARTVSVASGVQLLWSGSSECPTLNACAGGAGCLLRLEFGSARVEHHP